MAINDCRIFQVPKILDPRGNLSVIESGQTIPFEIKRVFYLYDVPGGETRAGHANIKLQQFILAASGSFDVVVDDGIDRKTFSLNRSYYGLYVPGMIWRELTNFSSGAVCIVLASEHYNAADYHREYADFKTAAVSQGGGGLRPAGAARR
jgi:dTDP-4-dehydrorhamnose 3,5-epimerase-like enzyme